MKMRQKSGHLTYKLKLQLPEGGGGKCHFHNLDLRLDPQWSRRQAFEPMLSLK